MNISEVIMKYPKSLLLFLFALNLFSQSPEIDLSTDSIYVITEPMTSITDSFYIGNQGDSDLNYIITYEYDGYSSYSIVISGIHINDFSIFPGTDYINENWDSVSGGAQASGNNVTAVLTSPQFDTSDTQDLELGFDQNFIYQPGSYSKVEYNDGTGWTEVYFNDTDSNSVHQYIDLPLGLTGQLRFTGFITKLNGNAGSWFIDNIEVSNTKITYFPYTWLTLNVPDSGSVTPKDSTKVSFTCEVTNPSERIYHADITISSDDPDEPELIIPLVFEVGYMPEIPSNVGTSILGPNIYVSWSTIAYATSYDVYCCDNPFGTYYFLANVTDCWYTDEITENRKFYYVVSRRDP